MAGEYSSEDGKKLLKLARQTIESKFRKVDLEPLEGAKFLQARGVFVTLTENGKLRGCIGLPYPVKSIKEAVIDAARSAAFSDPRFSSVKEEELGKLRIELSILTIPRECKPGEVEVGKDGLICSYINYGGLLLPQVASENSLNRVEFLEALCRKASLPKDKWQDNNFKLCKFGAQIFSE